MDKIFVAIIKILHLKSWSDNNFAIRNNLEKGFYDIL